MQEIRGRIYMPASLWNDTKVFSMKKYWDIFEAECMENIKMVREMKDKGFSEDQMLDKFKEKSSGAISLRKSSL